MNNEDKNRLYIALKRLFDNDAELIQNKVWETSVSAKLIGYMQDQYADYSVDHEYNKYRDREKLIRPSAKKSERPDIIVHVRNNETNFLAIEIKTKKSSIKNDLEKLQYLTSTAGKYRYQYGVHIEFGSGTDGRALIKNIRSIGSHDGGIIRPVAKVAYFSDKLSTLA